MTITTKQKLTPEAQQWANSLTPEGRERLDRVIAEKGEDYVAKYWRLLRDQEDYIQTF